MLTYLPRHVLALVFMKCVSSPKLDENTIMFTSESMLLKHSGQTGPVTCMYYPNLIVNNMRNFLDL